MSKQELLATIENDNALHVELLQKFLQAPSPNPPGDTRAAADVLTQFLEAHNIESRLFAILEDKPSVISTFNGTQGSGKKLVMNGHIDVFPVANADEWKHGPWSGAIDGGRIHGRGAVDMKSGTAALAIAYRYLYQFRQHLNGTVCFSAVADEETGGKFGSKALLEQESEIWMGDCMLNAEPSSFSTVRFGEKGTLRMTFTVGTAGALGPYLHLSKGAIRLATGFIQDLFTIEDLETDISHDLREHLARDDVRAVINEAMGEGAADLIGKNTVNIGTIKGGVKVNMIPESCTFEVDVRLPIGSTQDKVLAHIDKLVAKHMQLEKVQIGYEIQEAASNPPNSCKHDHEMVGIIIKNATGITGKAPLATPGLGGTDCKFWRYRGVPAYMYGISPKTMASTNESASVYEFLASIKVYAASAWDYLEGPP